MSDNEHFIYYTCYFFKTQKFEILEMKIWHVLSLQPDLISDKKCLRSVFTALVKTKKPVVFHNALTDLVFLYQNFYASLPSAMSTFIADLTEIFTGGVYDTKYVTDYVHRMPASYLEYVFRKRWDTDKNCRYCETVNKTG